MAKTAASDKLRPALQIFAKYHFWMLAAIVPMLFLPVLFTTLAMLQKQVKGVKDQIKASLDSLKPIGAETQHPNKFWQAELDANTARIKRETLAEWRRFWDSQAAYRTWPDSLGQDFVKAATSLKPDGKLSRKLLERYQDVVRSLARELPARMGAEESMLASGAMGESRPAGPGSLGPGGPGPAESPQPGLPPGLFQPGGPAGQQQGPSHSVVWNSTNQQQIYTSFDWEKAPTTTMVLMAQEELRVYGLLCDAIAHMNKSATGPHNAAIAVVNELLVGYPAATDILGGATKGRIRSPSQQASGGMGMMGMGSMEAAASPDGAASGGGRPPHPRFAGARASQGTPMAMSSDPAATDAPAAGTATAAGPTDDSLKGWVYVDFNDHPLDAAQLASAADAQMVHLMPFTMKLIMDQRQIDAFLVELATAPLPIDVRQVRINAASVGGSAAGPMMPSAMTEGMSGMSGMSGGGPAAGGRIYDVPVEIYGSIGLATQPSESALGIEPGQGEEPAGDEEKPPAGPKAAQALPQKRRIAA